MIVNGIQNHTVAIAAPVSSEAVGTTPMFLGAAETGSSVAAGAGVASELVSVTATMPFNLWTPAQERHSVFPRTCRGITPVGAMMAR